MKMLLIASALCLIANSYGQVNIPEERNYQYISTQEDYYFLWESTSKQSLKFDTVDLSQKCFAHILNNSQDTIILLRPGSRSDPLYWFYDRGLRGRDRILPGDTIHLKAKFARRHGRFSRAITVEHYRNSDEQKDLFRIPVSGFFKDEVLLKQLRERSNQQDAPKSQPKAHHAYILNENPTHDSIPIRVDYYTDGTTRYKKYKREGIVLEEFTRDGKLKRSTHTDGTFTTFFENGQPKYTRGLDRYSKITPYETYYFSNGCIKEKQYNYASIVKQYDSLNCGQLLQTISPDSIIKGTTITYYDKGEIEGISHFRSMKYPDRAEYKGTFSEGNLVNGTVSYYSYKNHLLFQSQIVNGERNNVLSSGEKQGNQINLKDLQGRKTGLWITHKKGNAPFPISSLGVKETISSTADFSEYNYVYSRGDTIAQVEFHYTGKRKSYSWIKHFESRKIQGKPVSISYHENGFVHFKSYELETGLYARVNYSDTTEGQIIGGKRGSGKMTFKNNQLVEVYCVKYPPATPDYAGGSTVNRNKKYACRAKGTFRNFELYNGFFYYYQGVDNLILTEKVINGVIQYNPRVRLNASLLENIAREHDLNFNKRIEQRELNNVTTMHFRFDSLGIEKFPFNELYKFKKLESIVMNGLRYTISDYASKAALKSAIHKRAGNEMPRRRNPWDPMPEPPMPEPPMPPMPRPIQPDPGPQPTYFPDVEAEFPGGIQALQKFIKDNLIYPDVAREMNDQGKVYVSFIIEKDGGITNVKVERGISQEFDREAKRLMRIMPNWIPAECQGKVCRSRAQLPIAFTLQ
jgi:protein TonB